MIEVVHADITTLDVDAIVTAANASLAGGGGVDAAVHQAAGPELLAACRRIGECPPGNAVLTPGFRARAKYVIHAVGPIWGGGDKGEPQTLTRAYEAAFQRAKEAGDIRSIAFPAISTGTYRFPAGLAASIAVQVMRAHDGQFQRIVACLFDGATTALYWDLLSQWDVAG